MVARVIKLAADWTYDVVSIGYPGPVLSGQPSAEPVNLGRGWVAFDFAQAFGRPVNVMNDAAMQALGSYEGGKMLFLGLGTGLGSALIADGAVKSMELGHLPSSMDFAAPWRLMHAESSSQPGGDLAAFVASQGLHGSVVHHITDNRTPARSQTRPSPAQEGR